MNDLLDMIAENFRRPDGADYLDPVTNLVTCGKCGTPKEYDLGEEFGHRKMPVRCACQKERDEAEENADRLRRAQDLAAERRERCFRSVRLKEASFERDDSPSSKASEFCREYAENFAKMKDEGRGIVLYGPVGTGKSYLAAAICNRVIDLGHTAAIRSITELAEDLTRFDRGISDEAKRLLTNVELVVFDDLGTERSSDFMREGVQRVVDMRYNSALPMIFTTNYSSEKMKQMSTVEEQRLFSRILECCDFVRLDGADRRKKRYIERRKDGAG